ncbi:unnamed protein product [Cuscuta campestris]|uniref:UDP-glycosyltransferases domain-containing protein n=1 Tax=Cuscuta campestris TaxID=132261 RepID=A0A484LPG0_9ASTE|nr:unnamed protein product [Cuscuta campestris]
MAPSHMIPTLDLAKLFASSNGVKSTIVTTPYNQPFFSKPIQTQAHIEIRLLPEFPGIRAGLPGDCQRLDHVAKNFPGSSRHALCSTSHLSSSWRRSARTAWSRTCSSLGPRRPPPRSASRDSCFTGSGVFPCVLFTASELTSRSINVSSDSESFVLPGLPHRVSLTRLQVPPSERKGSDDRGDDDSAMSEFMKRIWETEETSYGVIFNSFYELEPDYAEHYRNVLGRRSWFVGPLSLGKRDMEHKAEIGKMPVIDEKECLEWLDSKKPDSVVYICFGSLAKFSDSQLREMAVGIEDSEQEFIWVLRSTVEEEKEWIPGVCGRAHGHLAHPGRAVRQREDGDVYSEDGRRSGFERVDGVRERWREGRSSCGGVMIGEESEEMRGRAKALKEKARKAVEEGGSSYSDLSALLDELRA